MEETIKALIKLTIINDDIICNFTSDFKMLVETVLPVLPDKSRSSELLARLAQMQSLCSKKEGLKEHLLSLSN